MKCPYRKETTIRDGLIIEDFGECYKDECPFYGQPALQKRYEGGYTSVIKPVCRRTIDERTTEK